MSGHPRNSRCMLFLRSMRMLLTPPMQHENCNATGTTQQPRCTVSHCAWAALDMLNTAIVKLDQLQACM